MPVFVAIAAKDLRVLCRDRMALFWTLVFPVVFGLFFGSVMRVGDDERRAPIPVVLVAAQGSGPATELGRALQAAGLEVTRASREAARDAVRRGQAALYIDLPAADELRPIELGRDPSRRAESAMAEGALRAVLLSALSPREVVLPPIETTDVTVLQQGPRSGYEAVFPMMILWGLIGCSAAFAVALVGERSSGTLLRLYAAPIRRGSILAGKAMACASACVVSALALSAVAVLGLGVELPDPAKYGAALLASCACFVGLTQVLSVLGRTEQSVAGAGWSLLIVLAMTGGAMVPAVLMPQWLLTVSALSPVRWGIEALEGATFRALSWSELARPLGLSCALAVVGFAVAALVLRAREV